MLEEMKSLKRMGWQVIRLIDISTSHKMLNRTIPIPALISNIILLRLKHLLLMILRVVLLEKLLLKALLIQTTRLIPHYGSAKLFFSFFRKWVSCLFLCSEHTYLWMKWWYVCVMCKYQWYENIFVNKRVGVWNREIKRTNHGYEYCDVALCKKHFDIFHITATTIEGAWGFHYTWVCLQLTNNLKGYW